MEPKEKHKIDAEEEITTWGDIRVWVIMLTLIFAVFFCVFYTVAILGPTIGNIFSNVIVGLRAG